jgi:hypothetical protein
MTNAVTKKGADDIVGIGVRRAGSVAPSSDSLGQMC